MLGWNFPLQPPERAYGRGLSFPWWLRITHWFNFFFIVLLFRSGYEILMSHPKLYWTDDAIPGDE